MATVELSLFMERLDVALGMKGLSFARRSQYLLLERQVDYLLFPDMRGPKRRPLAVRVTTSRDDADALKAFVLADPIPTRYGEAARLYVQGCDDPETVARLLSLAFGSEGVGGRAGTEWDDGWQVFDPLARLALLRPDLPIVTTVPSTETAHARVAEVDEVREPETFEDAFAGLVRKNGFQVIRNKTMRGHGGIDLLLRPDGAWAALKSLAITFGRTEDLPTLRRSISKAGTARNLTSARRLLLIAPEGADPVAAFEYVMLRYGNFAEDRPVDGRFHVARLLPDGRWEEFPLNARLRELEAVATLQVADERESRSAEVSEQKGFVFEDRFADALRELSVTFVANQNLDRRKKTDFLIVHCGSMSHIRPVALQLTLRWNDYLKLRSFRDQHHEVRAGKQKARSVYLQVADGVTPEVAAVAIRDFVLSEINRTAKWQKVFMEIDADGCREFDVESRIESLGRKADPILTAAERSYGIVREVRTNGILIQRRPSPKRFWAYVSEIADSELLHKFREHQHGDSSLIGTSVSFIPDPEENPRGDTRAKSVILK